MNYVVLALLFSQKKNSVSPRVNITEDYFGYIRDWYNSMTENRVPGLILHDGLPEEFIKERTNEFIKFKKVDAEIYNTCDVRWVVYDKNIQEHGKEYDYIFANDISDVTMGKNPFLGDISKYPSNYLFSGDELASYSNGWIKDRNKQLKENLSEVHDHILGNPKLKLFNPGIIGGSPAVMGELCGYMAELVKRGGPIPRTADMSMYNYTLRTYFKGRVIHGSPVNSVFRKFQTNRKDVWFIHK